MQVRYLLGLIALYGSSALAAPIVYTATLNGGNESPPVASAGSGTATVTLDAVAHTLLVEVAFDGLTGTTTGAHIHCCTAVAGDGNAAVATMVPAFLGFPLGVTSGTYSQLFDTTLTNIFNGAFVTANGGTAAGAEAALAAGLAAGKAYLNIHTTFAAGGEIRGFLNEPRAAVPEPSTMLLSGAAMLVLAMFRGIRRRVR